MNKCIQKICVGGFLVLLLAAVLVLLLVRPDAPPEVKLPEPNGYKEIAKAAQRLKGKPPAENPLPTTEECRAYVVTNQEALRLVRLGLSRECRVPIQYSAKFLESHAMEVNKIEPLALALRLEGELAEREGRTGDAARIYIEIIHLGYEVVRGGLMVDTLLGTACQTIGLKSLHAMIHLLDVSQCREGIQTLESIDAKREAVSEVLQNEERFYRWSFGWRRILGKSFSAKSTNVFGPMLEESYMVQLKGLRVLQIELAARAFEKDQGHPPKMVAELVPGYLNSIPQNPSNGAPLTLSSVRVQPR